MGKFGVKEVMDVTFYDRQTNMPVLFLDTLKMSSVENTAEEVSARGGKGNPELIIWDFNREATVTLQDALLSPKSIHLLTGNAVDEDAATITMRQANTYNDGVIDPLEPLKVAADNKITLAFDPVGDPFEEDGYDFEVLVYLADQDGENVLEYADVNVNVVTLADSQAVGTEVIVYYQYLKASAAQTYNITSNSFPTEYTIVGDTVVRNLAGVDELFQVVIERAKVQPGFTLSFQAEGDPSVFDMNIKVLRGENQQMIKMIKY